MNTLYMGVDIAKAVTKSVIVTLENINMLTKCVANGPVYPGADQLFRVGILLVQLTLPNILPDIKVGDIVARHTITGDTIFYRGVKCIAVIDPKRKGDVLVSLDMPPLNCDFDGSDFD